MHNLTYISDKRTPHQIIKTTNNAKYQLNLVNKVSCRITIPSNLEKEIIINRFVYGVNDINIKFKLLRFYLNQLTFKHFNNIEMMSDIITNKFGIDKFIRYTIVLITYTPELFTINKSHYIISYLLNLAFNLIKFPNTKQYYKCYAVLLGYLQRDSICTELYNINKSILSIKPLVVMDCMSYKLIDMTTMINQYINNNNKLDIFISRHSITYNDDVLNINNIFTPFDELKSDSEEDYYSSDNDDTIKPNIKDVIIKKSITYSPLNTIPLDTDDSDSEPDETTPLLKQSKKFISYIDTEYESESDDTLQTIIPYVDNVDISQPYIDNNLPVRTEDIFVDKLSPNQELLMQPIMQLIPIIRQKAGIHVLKNIGSHFDNSSPQTNIYKQIYDSIKKDLPQVVVELLNKYPEHLIIAGGYLCNLILGTKCESSDLDIFILKMYDNMETEFNNDLFNVLNKLLQEEGNKVRISQNISALSIVSTKYITLQFIKTSNNTRQEVMNKFDIENCRILLTNDNNTDKKSKIFFSAICGVCDEPTDNLVMKYLEAHYKLPNQYILSVNQKGINHKITLRVLKYLSKGYKINYNKNMYILEQLSQICCNQSEEVLNSVGKHFKITNQSEDDIKKQMNLTFGGVYLGEEFDSINLIPYSENIHKNVYDNPCTVSLNPVDIDNVNTRHRFSNDMVDLMELDNITKINDFRMNSYHEGQCHLYKPSCDYCITMQIPANRFNIIQTTNESGVCSINLTGETVLITKINKITNYLFKGLLNMGSDTQYLVLKNNNNKATTLHQESNCECICKCDYEFDCKCYCTDIIKTEKRQQLINNCSTKLSLDSKTFLNINYYKNANIIVNNELIPLSKYKPSNDRDIIIRIKILHYYHLLSNNKNGIKFMVDGVINEVEKTN